MGLTPLDRQNWVLSSFLPLALAGGLALGRRALPLSTASYALIAAFLALHTIGAHYTYAQVPLGHWLREALALERNPFDRVAHFAFGLLLTYPLLEGFQRLTGARHLLLYYLAFMTQLGLAGAWEILESWVARLSHPELGAAFLGAQGDVWDAQRDMSAATGGAAVALLVTAGWRWLAARRSASRAMPFPMAPRPAARAGAPGESSCPCLARSGPRSLRCGPG
jgi:putative membrane protein